MPHQSHSYFLTQQRWRQTQIGANTRPLLTSDARIKCSHSKDCGASVGKQSHRAKEPQRHPRRPCPHQTTAVFDGRSSKQQTTRSTFGLPRSSMVPQLFHLKVSSMHHREYKTFSPSLGRTPPKSMSMSPCQMDKITLASFLTTCGQAQSTLPH